ncbi:MAG TPA: Uma2 family endonuclease [Gemmatimonadaceae bacterium]|nr:Uma2 family endonuclease [Gemmatimonadaceae bacterium]
MPAAAHRWTAEDVRALPNDGNRYELISGQLVATPSPRGIHQVAVVELASRLGAWLKESRAGHLLFSPADISLGEDEVLQPDLFIYRTASGRQLRDWSDIAALLLVIEVLSPSSARYDRNLKRRRYQRARVPEYWIVDLDGRVIERWRPDDERPAILGERLTREAVPGADALELDLRALFAEIWGDEPSPN